MDAEHASHNGNILQHFKSIWVFLTINFPENICAVSSLEL